MKNFTRIALLGIVLMSMSTEAKAQRRPEPYFSVTRTLGFRPAGFMNFQSDYSFQVFDKGNWKYRAFAGTGDGPYTREGKLPFAIEKLEEQLQSMGVNDIPEPDLNAPQIADLPTLRIRRTVDGKPWTRELRPKDEMAMAAATTLFNPS